MREAVLALIVGTICCSALLTPRIGLLGYVWFGLMRPDFLAWSRQPYSMLLAVSTLAGLLRFPGNIFRIFKSPITILLLALQIPLALSAIFAVVPEMSAEPYALYRRVIFMSLLVPALICTVDEMKQFVIVSACSLGILGAKYGLFGLIQGGVRFTEGPGGFLSDNNTFALAMTMAVPLLYYARRLLEAHWAKMGVTFITIFTMAAIIMTFSRGAAIALTAVFLTLLRRSKRKVALLLALVIGVGPAVYLVKDAYFARMATLENPREEGSANARIIYARYAWRLAQDYPWLGVGFGEANAMQLQSQYVRWIDKKHQQVIHNTYLQMLTDSGFIALSLYVFLLFGTIYWLGRSADRMNKFDPKLAPVPLALQGALLAYAVGSTFLSRVTFDVTYFMITAAAVWYLIEREHLAALAEAETAADDETHTTPDPDADVQLTQIA